MSTTGSRERESDRLAEVGPAVKQVPTFCALCVSRCGAKATLRDGVLTELRPDPAHPTGRALCVKGRAAPEIVYQLAERFPLILTCAKSLWFCETQHRNIAGLRGRARDPQVELHLDTATARGIAAGDWVRLDTPLGGIRARAKLSANLDPEVVCGQHGWWQACPELGLPGYPPLGPGTANLNAVLPLRPSDPISGSPPLRASICEVSPLATEAS